MVRCLKMLDFFCLLFYFANQRLVIYALARYALLYCQVFWIPLKRGVYKQDSRQGYRGTALCFSVNSPDQKKEPKCLTAAVLPQLRGTHLLMKSTELLTSLILKCSWKLEDLASSIMTQKRQKHIVVCHIHKDTISRTS